MQPAIVIIVVNDSTGLVRQNLSQNSPIITVKELVGMAGGARRSECELVVEQGRLNVEGVFVATWGCDSREGTSLIMLQKVFCSRCHTHFVRLQRNELII